MRSSPSIWLIMVALLGTHMAGMGAFLTVPAGAMLVAALAGAAVMARLHFAPPRP